MRNILTVIATMASVLALLALLIGQAYAHHGDGGHGPEGRETCKLGRKGGC